MEANCLEMLAQPRRFFANPVLLRQGWCHNIAKTLGSIGGSVFVVLMILSWQEAFPGGFFDATMPDSSRSLLGLGRALFVESRLGAVFRA